MGGRGLTVSRGGKDDRLTIIHGFNYKKLKLFLLSILWRAGAAKSQMFRRVNLGPYEVQIRDMIYRENPGEVQDYGCITYALIRNGKLADFVMGAPTVARMEIGSTQCHAYDFIFGGLHWRFLVAQGEKVPKEIYQCFLQKDGTFYVQSKPFEESVIDQTLRKAALNEHIKSGRN